MSNLKEQKLVGLEPVQCQSMQDVRREIDRVDRALVDLLVERLCYIEQAGHIKPSRETVRDEARIADVITKTRAQGDRRAGNLTMIEDVFRHLVEWSIAHEFKVFDQRDVGEGEQG